MRYIFLLAYVDPGSGLLIWQLLASAVVGWFFYFKKTREFIRKQLRRLLRRSSP